VSWKKGRRQWTVIERIFNGGFLICGFMNCPNKNENMKPQHFIWYDLTNESLSPLDLKDP
jgi:hypothetical protein